MVILPLSAMCFMVLKGFLYAIAVDVYAFRLAFSGKLHPILQHFTLRLAPKRTAFSTRTQGIQHQNTRYFAPKRTVFCCKQPRNWCKWLSFQIKIHFPACTCHPYFASKQTFARIDFLRQGWRLVTKKAVIMLNFLLKTGQ